MSLPHDSCPADNGDGRTTSQPEAASDQDMHVLPKKRQAPRILVVDDHPTIAGLMSQLLIQRGYDVVTAADAEQAEAEVRRLAPDLILSDVRMPGKSGYELCRELKADPTTRLIPFVLITGLSDGADKLRGIEAGADDFLNKPVLAEELTARVKSLLRVKEFTDELETADSVLCTLGMIVEGREPYTEGHCERLALYGADLGRHLGLDEDSIVALRQGIFARSWEDRGAGCDSEKGLGPYRAGVGDHEAASGDWGEYLQAAEIVAAGAADYSASS
jgi:DNA-binding response OmpR family regulator